MVIATVLDNLYKDIIFALSDAAEQSFIVRNSNKARRFIGISHNKDVRVEQARSRCSPAGILYFQQWLSLSKSTSGGEYENIEVVLKSSRTGQTRYYCIISRNVKL